MNPVHQILVYLINCLSDIHPMLLLILAPHYVQLEAVRVVPLRQRSAHHYHECVAHRLLEANPRIVLPVWLVHWFAESLLTYDELLRVYLQHNHLEDACSVALGIFVKKFFVLQRFEIL